MLRTFFGAWQDFASDLCVWKRNFWWCYFDFFQYWNLWRRRSSRIWPACFQNFGFRIGLRVLWSRKVEFADPWRIYKLSLFKLHIKENLLNFLEVALVLLGRRWCSHVAADSRQSLRWFWWIQIWGVLLKWKQLFLGVFIVEPVLKFCT